MLVCSILSICVIFTLLVITLAIQQKHMSEMNNMAKDNLLAEEEREYLKARVQNLTKIGKDLGIEVNNVKVLASIFKVQYDKTIIKLESKRLIPLIFNSCTGTAIFFSYQTKPN